jgi:hypothetical protein
MTTIALFRKHKQHSAPEKHQRAPDSLDFRDLGPAKPAETPGAKYVPKPKQAAVKVLVEPAPKSRGGIVLPAAIAGAIALAIAYVTAEPEAPAPAAPVKATPAPVQKAPLYAAPKATKPAVTATVPPPPAPRVQMPAVPTAFLQPFQAYTIEAGSKAIALALDRDGRFAHAIVARHPVQAEANGEALADCERYRAGAGVQEPCRLFAVGDRIVW